MKSLGIIGGLGPATTATFYLDVISSCQKKGLAVRPSIIIANVPIPLEIEKEAITENRGVERFIPFLVHEAQRLEKAGADFIVMPCNSLHIFIEDIRSAVHIPVLSIVEETTAFLQSLNITKVGVLSTLITRESKLYERVLRLSGIICESPSDPQQEELNSIVHNLVMGQGRSEDREELVKVISDFERKQVDCALLACTDLQLLKPRHPRMQVFDTMKILADATVERLLENGQKGK